MTALYVGSDLHSNNNAIGLIDEQGKRVFRKRLPNDRQVVRDMLSPYKSDINSALSSLRLIYLQWLLPFLT